MCMAIWWVAHCCQHISCYFVSCSFLGNRREDSLYSLRDNAANMIVGMNCTNLISLSCFAYSLQLFIKGGVLTQPAVQQLLSTARSLVDHYHWSNPAFQTFCTIQSQLDLPEHVLTQDVSTRWNISYYMLERLVEQKKAITAAKTECQPPAELYTQQ